LRNRWETFFRKLIKEKCSEIGVASFAKSSSDDIKNEMSILVVSHGSIMKQIIKYFVHDLKCDFGEHDASLLEKSAPNASVTKFSLNVGDLEDVRLINIKCECIHESLVASNSACNL
jgi:broad specificity phosphatase PhoE